MASIRPKNGTDEKAARTQIFSYLRANAGIETFQGIEKRRGRGPLPLSFAQERLWFLDQLQPGSAAHNICRAQRLRGPLDIAALTRAFNEVVRRHEALRTCFRRDEEQPAQVICESPTMIVPVFDLSAVGENSHAAEVARVVCDEARRPFDLAAGPLLRPMLIKCAPANHVFVLTVHQMVFDAWSIGLFFRELAPLYEAEISAKPAALPNLPVQYADYAIWQRERLRGEALQSQLTFWKSRLGGALPILSLPMTHARPRMQSHRGARRALSVGHGTLTGLLVIGRRAGATLFETLMAAFNALLYRYCGQRDIIVGFPVANRERTEIENLIGFFVNTLPLRMDLSGDPSFAELLQRVCDGCREIYKHRELPFEKLVEELRVERDLTRNPIFQAMFAYQNEAPPLLRLPGVSSEPMASDAGAAKFDLTLSLMRRENKLIGFFEYDSELFDAACIDRMAGHWQTLLDGIVADPDQPLSKAPMLTEGERRRVLVHWNETATDLPKELCIHELFEAQVERTPDAVALAFDGEILTYRELNRRANQLAHYLRSLGVGPEVIVGICLERNLQMLIGLLGILKAGGAYLPIDPAYPGERIAFMLQDARISVVITQKDLTENRRWRIEDGDCGGAIFDPELKLACLDQDAAAIDRQSSANPNITIDSKSLAYVIYTSGSTGQPKGVAIEHRNAVALLSWARSEFGPADLAGMLASTSICFDLSVFETFLPLISGGSVILAENALQLRSCAAKDRVTLVNVVPSAMGELLATGGLPQAVRIVNLAGEPLSTELVRQIYQTRTVKKVYDLYGPSETTTYSTFALRTPETPATIGRPIANTKIYILDPNLQPVPVGVQGEIFIGGAGVARGYLNRPESTCEKFLPDPFVAKAGTRMYRTGDFGRYLPDGNIVYLGRADQQVKIRGYRIELGEIEAALNCYPAVSQSIVVVQDRETREPISSDNPKPVPSINSGRALSRVEASEIQNPKFDKQMVAYLVINGMAMPPAGALRSFLREKLPEFMMPEVFVTLDQLPLNANGKVDRSALPAPDREPGRLSGDFIAPRTEIEELIAQAWREALKVEEVGVNDNFFDLGGHSLLATRVLGRLRASFAVELELRKLFELPTVSALAGHIEWLRRDRSAITMPAISVACQERDQAPLSFAQQRLWFLHQLDPELTAYNMAAAYRIKGPLNIAALENAFKQMVERHDILRTAIVEIDGRPAQRIFAHAEITIPLIDLTTIATADGETKIEHLANEHGAQPFDFHRAPLLRVKLLRLAVDDHVMLINFHHIIADATSLSVFYRELAALYEAAAKDADAKLAVLAARYADFAAWQQDWRQHSSFSTQLDHWKRKLGGGLRPLSLPTDFEAPAHQAFRGAKLSHRLSAELTGALKSLGRRHGATLFMTLLAALKLLLARLSGQNDVVVGTTIAGRNRPELEGVIGFFINALALRTELSGNPTFVELLQRVRAVCLDAYTHQDMPFERLVEEINPQRDLGRNPIFQVLFNMADAGERDLMLAGCEIYKTSQSMPGAKFDLVMRAPQIDGCIVLTMIYNVALFSEARIAAMLEQFGFLLEQLTAEPGKPTDMYSLFTPQSKKILPDPTEALDDTWRDAIHSLVSRHAERQPDTTAVVDGQQSWSYGELDRASNRLANYLVADGVKPKDVVAIYAHRDASLAVGLLGVLKAGAVFVVLDPAYPPARLAEYFRIAKAKTLLQMEGAGKLPDDLVRLVATSENCTLRNLPRAAAGRLMAECSDRAPEVSVSAQDPAYIAFTSGSTGQPKGVVCRHGPITHFLPWQDATFNLKGSDRYSLLSGLAYNHLQRELFTPLASAAAVYVPTSDCLKEPEHLLDWLCENEITILHLTPALARQLCGAGKTILPSVRRIFFGGDLLTRADVSAMHELAPNAEMVSFYGATETQRAVGYCAISAEMFTANYNGRRVISTGRGVRDVQLLLLTPGGQLAGVGEVGELYVRSPHLAAGYIDDEALTAAAFVANPFTGQADDRLYRTGELGRYAPDGNVEWVGRQDRRASVRGFRVDLSEIESALGGCPGVRNCAVVVKDFETSGPPARTDERLVAYIEREAEVPLDVDGLRRSLSARLPHYMVPSHFHLMDRLPLSPNGKVDFDNLPSPDHLLHSVTRPFEAPRNSLEQTLGDLLAKLLGMERMSRLDNFFDLGGHSLLAAQAVARIRELLHVRLDVRVFFESSTVEALARRIAATQTSPETTTAAELDGREEIEI